MKRKFIVFLLLLSLLLSTTAISAQNLEIALISDIGGFGDDNYNDQLRNAFSELQSESNIEVEVKESKLMTEYADNINQFAERDFDLIWGVGFTMEQAIKEAAQMYPDLNFVIFDGIVEEENVLSITFKKEEAAFIAGVIAGLESQNSVVAFIGGKENSEIQSYQAGFNKGVKTVDSEVEVINRYVGSFNDFSAAKKLSEEVYNQNADIIFYAAGASSRAIIETAVEKDIKLISLDQSDSKLAPKNVLTTILKNTKFIVENTVENFNSDNYINEVKEYGIADNAFILDLNQAEDMMSEEVINKIEEYKHQLISSEIKIPVQP